MGIVATKSAPTDKNWKPQIIKRNTEIYRLYKSQIIIKGYKEIIFMYIDKIYNIHISIYWFRRDDTKLENKKRHLIKSRESIPLPAKKYYWESVHFFGKKSIAANERLLVWLRERDKTRDIFIRCCSVRHPDDPEHDSKPFSLLQKSFRVSKKLMV